MNPLFVPIVVDGVKLVPKLQPNGSCAGCELQHPRPCYDHPCYEDGESIIYVKESNVPQT